MLADPDNVPVFHLFPLLPPELRLRIWYLASHAQRTLELNVAHRTKPQLEFISKVTSSQPPPAVLHACQESRSVGRSAYRLSFGTERYPPSIYFNPENDIIYFGPHQTSSNILSVMCYFFIHRQRVELVNLRGLHAQFMLMSVSKSLQSKEELPKVSRVAFAQHHWTPGPGLSGSILQLSNSLRPGQGGSMRTQHFFHAAFSDLEELIVLKCDEDFDRNPELPWEEYSGVSLRRSAAGLSLRPGRLREIYREAKSSRSNHSEQSSPKVVVMDYGCSNCLNISASCPHGTSSRSIAFIPSA